MRTRVPRTHVPCCVCVGDGGEQLGGVSYNNFYLLAGVDTKYERRLTCWRALLLLLLRLTQNMTTLARLTFISSVALFTTK